MMDLKKGKIIFQFCKFKKRGQFGKMDYVRKGRKMKKKFDLSFKKDNMSAI